MPTVRAVEKPMTGLEAQQSRGLKHHQQLENFSLRPSVNCDFRIWVLPVASNLFSLTGWTLVIEQPHLALIPRGYLIHKDSLLGCAYSTAGKDKAYDQGMRILCTLDASGKPTVSSKVGKINCGRPLMGVTEVTECGRWGCFRRQWQRVSFELRIRQKIDFTPTLGGWDLTMTLETTKA